MGFEDFFDLPQSDYEDEKRKFIGHMDSLKNMTNEEHTLFKKWIEIQGHRKSIDKASLVKAAIWRPTDLSNKELTLEELSKLEPDIHFVDPADKSKMDEWLVLRTFIHTMEFEQNPGRFLRFTIVDKNTGKYLGVTSLGSDVISISCRDKWVGWTEDMRIKQGKIRHSAIATTIVAVQPFGYNFLGGKLIASMMCMPAIQNAWKEMYDETLVGITTTSLYGKHSMYQRIPFWKELGETTGKIMLKPTDDYYQFWHHWLKDNKMEEYTDKTTGGNDGPATGIKQKILVMIMQELKMKQSTYMHGFKRGVYYSPFYENTREYLRGEIDESKLVPLKKLEGGIKPIMDWWTPKAIHRYESLMEQGRLNPEILYYNRMIGMSWDEAKKTYLEDVGR